MKTAAGHRMNGQKSVKAEFFRLTGVLPRYQPSRFEERRVRGNYIFNGLAEKVFDHPRLLVILKKKISGWLAQSDEAFTLALAGYIDYMAESYRTAESFFLRALKKDRKNLDLWLDLAFCLYHQDIIRQRLAHDILFSHKKLSMEFTQREITLEHIARFIRRHCRTATAQKP